MPYRLPYNGYHLIGIDQAMRSQEPQGYDGVKVIVEWKDRAVSIYPVANHDFKTTSRLDLYVWDKRHGGDGYSKVDISTLNYPNLYRKIRIALSGNPQYVLRERDVGGGCRR